MLAQSGVTSQPLESSSVPCGKRETPNARRLLLWCRAQMMISFSLATPLLCIVINDVHVIAEKSMYCPRKA